LRPASFRSALFPCFETRVPARERFGNHHNETRVCYYDFRNRAGDEIVGLLLFAPSLRSKSSYDRATKADTGASFDRDRAAREQRTLPPREEESRRHASIRVDTRVRARELTRAREILSTPSSAPDNDASAARRTAPLHAPAIIKSANAAPCAMCHVLRTYARTWMSELTYR